MSFKGSSEEKKVAGRGTKLDKTVYECPFCCARIMSKEANLRRHMSLHAPLVDKFQCDICGVICSNSSNFKKHCDRLHPTKTEITASYVQQKPKPQFQVNNVNSNKTNKSEEAKSTYSARLLNGLNLKQILNLTSSTSVPSSSGAAELPNHR